MELKALTYFLTTAEKGNITKAARELHISQPSLSKQIKNLEEELDCQLFIRKSHSVLLTKDGIHLKQRAEEILGLVNRTEEEFYKEDTPLSGTVYIGSEETQSLSLIAEVVRIYRNKHGNVTFSFFSESTDEILNLLELGLIDFGIVKNSSQLIGNETLSIPGRDKWYLLVPKEHPLSIKNRIRPEDLIPYPLVLPYHLPDENVISDWLSLCKEPLSTAATYDQVTSAVQLVNSGVGVALIPKTILELSEGTDLCLKPLEPSLETEFYLTWKRDKLLSRQADSFLEQLKRELKTERE